MEDINLSLEAREFTTWANEDEIRDLVGSVLCYSSSIKIRGYGRTYSVHFYATPEQARLLSEAHSDPIREDAWNEHNRAVPLGGDFYRGKFRRDR